MTRSKRREYLRPTKQINTHKDKTTPVERVYHTCPECSKEISCTKVTQNTLECECENVAIHEDYSVVCCSYDCQLEFEVFGD